MTLSGGGSGCRDDIIVHSSCDVSCDVNWPMDVGDTHLLVFRVNCTLTVNSYSKNFCRRKYCNFVENQRLDS